MKTTCHAVKTYRFDLDEEEVRLFYHLLEAVDATAIDKYWDELNRGEKNDFNVDDLENLADDFTSALDGFDINIWNNESLETKKVKK